MKPIGNQVILKVDQQFHETIEHGGLKLDVDPLFDPTRRAVTEGEILAIPEKWNTNDMDSGTIVPELEVGDKVFFHFNTTSNDNYKIEEGIYRCPYFRVYCKLDPIYMVGSWVLLDMAYEEGVEEIEGMKGEKIMAKVQNGFVVDMSPKPIMNEAIVRHIGKPLLTEPELPIGPGDRVALRTNLKWQKKQRQATVDGHTYYLVRQEDIVAKLETVSSEV